MPNNLQSPFRLLHSRLYPLNGQNSHKFIRPQGFTNYVVGIENFNIFFDGYGDQQVANLGAELMTSLSENKRELTVSVSLVLNDSNINQHHINSNSHVGIVVLATNGDSNLAELQMGTIIASDSDTPQTFTSTASTLNDPVSVFSGWSVSADKNNDQNIVDWDFNAGSATITGDSEDYLVTISGAKAKLNNSSGDKFKYNTITSLIAKTDPDNTYFDYQIVTPDDTEISFSKPVSKVRLMLMSMTNKGDGKKNGLRAIYALEPVALIDHDDRTHVSLLWNDAQAGWVGAKSDWPSDLTYLCIAEF